MDFKNYLETAAQQIDQQLDVILSQFLKQVKKTNPRLTPYAKGLINACKGGKRVRGVLVKLGYELAGGIPNKEILKISAAFEILHSAILIHDDIMDQSELRRGKPTLYKALGGNHYGISQALTLGDIGFFLAVKIIAETNFSEEVKVRALSYFSQMVINTGWGQILDVDKGDKEFVDLYKTAKYTVAGPLQIGAILAGAEKEIIRVFGDFGEELGIAFQIRDDILDGEVESRVSAQTKALEYATRAKKIIPKMTNNVKMRKLLEETVEFMVNRKK